MYTTKYFISLFKTFLIVPDNVIFRILNPEEKQDWDDGEHDEGLGDDVVYHLLPVKAVKHIWVS